MLFIGEKVGTRTGPKVDIAVDPLEGTTLCAKDMPGSIAVMAMAEGGTLLNAPDVYMDKIAIGPGYPPGIVDLDATPGENINALAKAKGVKPGEITVLILDRLRHTDLIVSCREAGAAIRLITDGDVAGVIIRRNPSIPASTSISAPAARRKACSQPARCAASAARCRPASFSTPRRRSSARKRMGVKDPKKKYDMRELASGDVIVCATGVTDGALLRGVKFGKEVIETETVIYRSVTGTVRRIHAEHREMAKFRLD